MNYSEKYKNKVIRVRHAFKMDHHCEEVIAWNDNQNQPDFFTQGQGSEYLRVDADEETLQKWEDYQQKRNDEAEKRDNEHNKKLIKKESIIRVVRGRKSKGEEGEVYAIYDNPYSKYNKRIYFKNSKGEKLNSYLDNMEIFIDNRWIEPEFYERCSYKYICAGTY